MHENLSCEVCDSLVLAQGPVALILAQRLKSNLGTRATLQVRPADQAGYHHALTVSSLVSDCQACAAPG